ncbi:PAS domain-containing protein [Psychromarinibacter halotolerans]|uniref:PAS domain-containing protein n=1 Tax=Psychromarinibacter halotolerans TaxID=1775175 RepID=A0ABV7GQJ9_9RHOB|nr:PAS domain-containing protein [Psychromarinibacter halotolerans]MDF0594949.1 PAS domain-containing protein [Psychromarinibacter halotolerans]
MELRHRGFDNVVSLFGKAVPLKYPAIAQVDAYWEGLRQGRLMPDRAEVDPRGMDTALEYAFLMEHVAPGIARVRISGMHLRDLLGMEVRGMPLTAFFLPEARERIQKAVEAVVTTPQVADISLSGQRGIGRPALPARLFLAPLTNTEGRGNPRILACLESHGEIGRAPRRFTVDQVQMRRIVATAEPSAPEPDDAPTLTQAPAPTGFAEPAMQFRSRAQRPSLRLVQPDTDRD